MKINAVFGSGVAGRSYVVTRQRRVNCYYEQRDDKDKSAIALYGTPGMRKLFTVGSNAALAFRGMSGSPQYLYGVLGSTFYQLLASGSPFYSASIGTTAGPVSLAQNPSGPQVLLVDGALGWILNGGALAQVTSAGFPNGARTCAFAAGFFFAELPNTQRIWASNAFDGTTWSALAFASASAYADVVMAVDALIGNLVVFSSTHLEFWQNVGASPFPFAPIQSATAEYGLAAVFSRVHADNALLFLAQNPQGGYQFCRIDGYAIKPISTPDIEYILQTIGVVADCVGLVYRDSKHALVQWSFPSANRTLQYDCQTGMWGEAQTGLTAAYTQRHIGNFSALLGSTQLISDYASNTLYTPDATVFTDNGATILREVVTRHQLNEFNVFSVDEAYLDMDTGVGLNSGQGSNPQIQFECSKDNGRTWLTPRTVGIGAMGQYKARAVTRRWGSARVFDFRIRMTDPVKFACTAGASSSRVRPQT